ncbi:MAG TPA: hypothetical protein VFF69_02895 [Phycisphaerales bacterium]|nr:hypothetical protein [Phycisphaerales bacterium]
MNTRSRAATRPLLAAALALLVTVAGAPAGAQTEDELRDELARTRDELRISQALVATLREEIARLQAEVRELRGREGPGAGGDLPSDPLACPASMAAELARRYERDLAHLGGSSTPERFAAAATEWCDEMSRAIRGRREWLVSITDLEPLAGSRDQTARMRVFDEVSLLPLGEYELVQVPARIASRVEAEPDAALWLLTAEVAADPVYNPARASRGAFDEPPFVGPFVESGFALEWVSVAPTDLVPTASETPGEAPSLPEPPPPGRDR